MRSYLITLDAVYYEYIRYEELWGIYVGTFGEYCDSLKMEGYKII